MKPYKCKEFNKTGTVWLPSVWRKRFGFREGALVDLVYKSRSIIVKRHQLNSTDNTRVITGGGAVSIPSELKNILELTPDDEVCLFVDEKNECFIIKPVSV